MMKPVLAEAYDTFVKKIEEARETEKASSISNQTTQWQSQQRSVEVSTSTKEWNLQEALKGVVGVGTGHSEGAK